MLAGLDFVVYDKNIADILSDMDVGSLMPTGISLIGFSIFVFIVSKNINKYLVGVIIFMDALWVLGSIFLMFASAVAFTKIGLALISITAAIIAMFAIFQSFGLVKHLEAQTRLSQAAGDAGSKYR